MKVLNFSKTILIVLFSFFLNNTFSQTIINSNIFSNTNWALSGSPYIITTNLIIFEGVTLSIDPGVVVKVNDNLGIEVRGKLYAVGTAVDSITFTSSSSSPTIGIWKGFVFSGTTNPLGSGDQATFDYCNGMYATTFADLDIAYHGPYRFSNCFFYKNGKVNYDGGLPKTYFTNCIFLKNDTGLSYPQFGGTASHCIFLNNNNAVDNFENVDSSYFSGNTGIALAPYGSAKDCIVENNNVGVKCLFNSVNNTFINNSINNNSIGVEIMSYFNGVIQFTNNSICDNTVFNIKYTWPNNADISNNCWCSADSVFIRSTIYDGYSPGSSSGLIKYLPLAPNCSRSKLFSVQLCPSVDNKIIKAGIPGSTYQWQLNTGGGFSNIADNINYTGSNSGSLQLSNIPSAWYGYQYRCVVDGDIYTPPVSIVIKTTWIGSGDDNWENPVNWSCGSIPDANTDVIVNAGNVVLNANTVCRSLTVKPGASYTVSPGVNLIITH